MEVMDRGAVRVGSALGEVGVGVKGSEGGVEGGEGGAGSGVGGAVEERGEVEGEGEVMRGHGWYELQQRMDRTSFSILLVYPRICLRFAL